MCRSVRAIFRDKYRAKRAFFPSPEIRFLGERQKRAGYEVKNRENGRDKNELFFQYERGIQHKEAVSQVIFGQDLQDSQVVFLKNRYIKPVNLVNPVRKLLVTASLC